MKWLKQLITLLLIIPFTMYSQYVNCFDESGIGMFEGSNPTSNWTLRTETSGSLSVISSDSYSGSNSLKATVTNNAVAWHVRMITNGCDFELVQNKFYKVSFYLKSPTGGEMDIALRDGGTTLETKRLSLESNTDWVLYELIFESEVGSTNGKLYLNYRTEGEYFIDHITVSETDCHGDIGGSASIDLCDYCSGGNTAIDPGSLCDLITLTPDHENLRISGTLSQVSHTNGIELHRFVQDFYTNGHDGNWSVETARTQSGVSIEIKTNSPVINFQFSELENSLQRTAHYAVFKNNELYRNYITDDTVKILNLEKDLAVWKVTTSVFRGVVFNGVEISNGYTSEDLGEDNRPTYFAIGNSITHGNGQDHGGHLSYPYQVADSLGFHVHNLGIGGSKVTSEILRNIQGQQIDYITVLWGYNDLFGGTGLDAPGGFFEKYDLLLDSICVLQPQAKIFAIKQTPTHTVSTGNGTIEEVRIHQENTVLSLQNTCSNLKLIESHDYVNLQTDLTDNVHLNVQGATNLAHGIIEEILMDDPNIITSIGNFDQNKTNFYPNPTSSMLHLSDAQDYKLYNMTGILLKSGHQNEIDLSDLPKGLYLLKVEEESLKVIKE